ncbi:MAG: hypothetical protein KAU23_06175 [Anaerolineales bacterium]|nr:hypothetical protein [Anaerolineales bacterium]
MKTKSERQTKFFWCPVCMVHTYHRKTSGEWECLNEDHQIFLRLRKDPWIEEYRASRASAPALAGKIS